MRIAVVFDSSFDWSPDQHAAQMAKEIANRKNVEPWMHYQVANSLRKNGHDVLLLATGVGGELDSKEAHGASELLDLTLLRHGRVERYGAKLLHVTPSRYRAQPAAFHHDLFVEVRDRQARGLGHPASLRVTPRGPVLCGTGHARPYPVPAWALDAARSGTLPDDLLRAS